MIVGGCGTILQMGWRQARVIRQGLMVARFNRTTPPESLPILLPMRVSVKVVVALILTCAAGCVDVIGYLALFHSFTAHVTGVTVNLGKNMLHSHWHRVGLLFGSILAFLFGSILGRVSIEISSRSGIRRSATPPLLLEAGLIAAVALLGMFSNSSELLVLLLAAAMGLQTAALNRVGSLTVHTTFVTGMLNKLAQLLSNVAFLLFGQYHARKSNRHKRNHVLKEALFVFSVWCFYLVGAVMGVWMEASWKFAALLVPAAFVLLVAAIDLLHPLSIQQEHDFPDS